MQITEIRVHAQEHRNIGDYSSYESYVSLAATVWPGKDLARRLADLQDTARAAAVADCDRFEAEKQEAKRIVRDINSLASICEMLAGESYRNESDRRADEHNIETARRLIAGLPALLQSQYEPQLADAIERNQVVRAKEREQEIESAINALMDIYRMLPEDLDNSKYYAEKAKRLLELLPDEMKERHNALLAGAVEANEAYRKEEAEFRAAREAEKRRRLQA